MPQPFVHSAELLLDPGADGRAPGGAITLALCGSWDHAGPCRWPHHSRADWQESRGVLRVVFTADPSEEATVREIIEQALAGGHCTGPDGTVSRWTRVSSGAGQLTPEEELRAAECTSLRA